jgi:hypothetical protein
MQVKNIQAIEIRSVKWLGNWLKFLITFTSTFFVINQIIKQNIAFDDFEFPPFFVQMIIFQIILMLINWYLEVLRWKISVEPIEKISIKQACYDVFGGLTLNWVLPFTTGDYIARIASKKDKYQSTSAILLNRVIMFLLAITAGIFGMTKLVEFKPSYLLIIIILILSAYFLLKKTVSEKFLIYFRQLEKSRIWKVIFASLGRYGIFFLQFIILLKFFNPTLELLLILAGVGWIFFVRTSLPSLFGGLGLREASAFMFFQNEVTEINLVIIPVFLLWILNAALPSVLGTFLVWKLQPHYSSD